MDFSDCYRLFSVKLRIQGGISEIPKRFKASVRNQRSRLASAGFILTAIGLGAWANTLSQSEAILKWERTHLPSDRVFQHALRSRGMTLVQDIHEVQRALRALPVSFDQKGSVWSSVDSNWIVFYSDLDRVIQAQVFCLICSVRPNQWKAMGIGWRGLELALDALDEMNEKRSLVQVPVFKGKESFWRDSREIIY